MVVFLNTVRGVGTNLEGHVWLWLGYSCRKLFESCKLQNTALLQMSDVSLVFHVRRCLPSVEKLYILVVYHLRSRWCAEHFTSLLFQKLTILTFILKFYLMGLYIKLQNKDSFSWLSVIGLWQVAHGNEDWKSLGTTSLCSVILLGNELFEQQWWAPDGHQQLICHKNDKSFHRCKYWFHFPSALGNYMMLIVCYLFG